MADRPTLAQCDPITGIDLGQLKLMHGCWCRGIAVQRAVGRFARAVEVVRSWCAEGDVEARSRSAGQRCERLTWGWVGNLLMWGIARWTASKVMILARGDMCWASTRMEISRTQGGFDREE